MNNNLFLIYCLFCICFTFETNCQEVQFFEQSRIENLNSVSCYASKIDRLDRPFVYTANLQQGLKIYKTTSLNTPEQVAEIGISQFENQWVTNIIQYNDRLYLSLGDFQGATRPPGIGIIDVSNPENPVILGYKFFQQFDKGCSIIRIKEDMAYLGLMEHGVLAVDISDFENISIVKHITFDNDFPQPPGLFSKPHARGMDISGDYLYVCYDAGGLRAVDISEPILAKEVGQYVNLELDPVSNVVYNNIFIKDSRGYITLDYCGVEVIDLSDPTDMEVIALYNPNDCNGFNWVGSPSHTNEIIHDEDYLFVSAGDSEIWSFDTSEDLELNGSLAIVKDSSVTWGLDVFNNMAIGNFINVDPVYIQGFTPYYSDWGGWRLYSINKLINNVTSVQKSEVSYYPNPTTGFLTIENPLNYNLAVYNINGEIVTKYEEESNRLDISNLPSGLYILQVLGDTVENYKILKK